MYRVPHSCVLCTHIYSRIWCVDHNSLSPLIHTRAHKNQYMRIMTSNNTNPNINPNIIFSNLYSSSNFIISAGSLLLRRQASAELPPASPFQPSSHLSLCLIHDLTRNTFLLPKGRKDQHEYSLLDVALRETEEETGYECEVLPCRMKTRAPPGSRPPQDSYSNASSETIGWQTGNIHPRRVLLSNESTEPFAISIRPLGVDGITMKPLPAAYSSSPSLVLPTRADNIKLIFWFFSRLRRQTQASRGPETPRLPPMMMRSTRLAHSENYEAVFISLDKAIEKLSYQDDRDVVLKALEIVNDWAIDFVDQMP